MSPETIFTNAVLVLPRDTISGTLTVRGGTIVAVQPGRSDAPGAIDLDGDYLMPGAVDGHTDNLERQELPRAGIEPPAQSNGAVTRSRDRTSLWSVRPASSKSS